MADITVTLAQYLVDPTKPYLEVDNVTLSDTAANLNNPGAADIADLVANNVDRIEVLTGDLQYSLAAFRALGDIQMAVTNDFVVTATGAQLSTLTLAEINAMVAQGVDVLAGDAGAFTLALDEFIALGAITLDATGTSTVSGTAAEWGAFLAGNVTALNAQNIDLLDATGGTLTVPLAVLNTVNASFTPASDVTLTATLAEFAALTPQQIAGLPTRGIDAVVITDTSANLQALTAAGIAALAADGVDALDATDNVLSLDKARFDALGTIALTAGDAVTLTATLAEFAALTPQQIAGLPTRGIDAVVITDTSANLQALTAAGIAALAAAGVDGLDATDNALLIDRSQFDALQLGNIALTAGDVVTLRVSGAELSTLTPATLAGLLIDRIDATDPVTLTLDGLAEYGSVSFTAASTVTASATGAAIAALTSVQIAALVAQGVDRFDATDAAPIALTVAEYLALGSATFAADDNVTVSDTGAALAALSPAQIAQLTAKGVDAVDVTDALSVSLAQFNAFGSLLAPSESITLTDTGATIGGLAAAQIAALATKGVDTLDASDASLSLSVSQFLALGAITLSPSDLATLRGSNFELSSFSAAQLAALPGKGIDVLDVTDGILSLSSSQYASLGIPLAAGDALNISGTSGADTITGRASNDTLKGFAGADRLAGGAGDDMLYGGAGKDVLLGEDGRDVFVFDTKPKKANVDKIVDYNVTDDSVYLDNAVFKKLGKGSEANPTKLKKAFFTVGDDPVDSNDYLIYSKKTGVLFYDADGSGAGAAVQVATLKKNLKLKANDFFVI